MLHRYTLEKFKGMRTRYRCPQCKKDKEFVRYIDTETGQHLADHVGRCNRESKCGYHFKPKQYFENRLTPTRHTAPFIPQGKLREVFPDTRGFFTPSSFRMTVKNGSRSGDARPTESSGRAIGFSRSQTNALNPHHDGVIGNSVSVISKEIFQDTLNHYAENNFVKYLHKRFGAWITQRLIERYHIGTHNHWQGATVFWQVDARNNIHAGKIMLYNTESGKRVKEPTNKISYLHAILKLPDFNLEECLFGEHLLAKDKQRPVAIVESEKTAIIASCYFPRFLWMACGGLSKLNKEKLVALKGRRIILVPDDNGYALWKAKAREISSHIEVFSLLELAGVEKNGLDVVDWLGE